MFLNEVIFEYLNNWAAKNIFLDWAFIFGARYLIFFLLVLALFFLLRKKTKLNLKGELILVYGSSVLAWGMAEVLKKTFFFSRPFEVREVNLLISHPPSFAFPSGHMAFLTALGISIFWLKKNWGSFFIFCAFLVGISRVVVGVHWPLDVLGGIGVGVGAFLVLLYVFSFYQKKGGVFNANFE